MNFREKTKIKIAISKMTEKEKQMNKEKSFKNKIAIVASVIFIFSGVSLAANKIIENIWKEPEVVIGYYNEDGSVSVNPTYKIDEEKILTNEDVEKIAIQKIKEFGKEDCDILSVILEDKPQNTNLNYLVKAENGISISVDATNENSWSYANNNLGDVTKYRGNKEELENVVRNIIKNHNIHLKNIMIYLQNRY